ncbi:MAG: hypothetical protein ABR981_01860 [Candidatus Micrarchaeaceae archaeon]
MPSFVYDFFSGIYSGISTEVDNLMNNVFFSGLVRVGLWALFIIVVGSMVWAVYLGHWKAPAILVGILLVIEAICQVGYASQG